MLTQGLVRLGLGINITSNYIHATKVHVGNRLYQFRQGR